MMQKGGNVIVQASQPQKVHMATWGLLLKVTVASLAHVARRIRCRQLYLTWRS